MSFSERHHYLPKFYIKGFADKNGELSVYDKTTNQVLPKKKSPKQIFFEWNRNTLKVNGENADFLEGIFQFSETKFAPIYKKLTEKQEVVEMTPYDLFLLVHFISLTFWRGPGSDQIIANQIKRLKHDDLPVTLMTSDHRIASLDVLRKATSSPAFIKAYSIMKSAKEYQEFDHAKYLNNWKLYYTPKNSPLLHLISDNPLLILNDTSNVLHSELIFTLSSGKFVINTAGKTLQEIEPIFTLNMDLLVFLQAKKYVCGPNTSYLQSIAQLAVQYNTEDSIMNLKKEILELFK